MNKKLFFTILFLICFVQVPVLAAELVKDNLVDTTLQGKVLEKPPVKTNYN